MRLSIARRPDPSIDVTPMIDIVFQLVLFFMVSTTFISTPGIEVELPRAASQVVMKDEEDLRIWITAEGAIHVDEQPVDLRELRRKMRRAAESDANTLVAIKADLGVPHGRVVTVMDVARQEGLSRLGISTDAAMEHDPDE